MKSSHTLVVIGLLLCGGCGESSRDQLFTEQLDTMKEAGSVLARVKDVESARAAKPQVSDLAQRMLNLSKREKELPALTPDESTRLREKFKDRAQDVGQFGMEIVRLEFLAPQEVRAEIHSELAALRMDSPHMLTFLEQ